MSRQKEEASESGDPTAPAPRRAEWQLPSGVDRGLWDYLHASSVADGYDGSLAESSLFRIDGPFVERHCPPEGRLIDLGCGTGRLLIHLARRGRWVLGVDLSAPMLRIARHKADTAGLAVELLRANLTELDALAAQSFDCAACLFSTLGMIRGQEHRQRVLAHAFRLLKPGGRFVLHVHNLWFNLWNPQGRRWLLGNLGRSLLGRSSRGDRLMPVHQGIANLTLHLFTRREACWLLRQAGFRIVEVQPISLSDSGQLTCPWWFPGLRSYGYLIAAERPGGVDAAVRHP